MMTKEHALSLTTGRALDEAAALASGGYLWATHALQFSAEMAVKWLISRTALQSFRGMYRQVRPEEWQELKHRENYAEEVPRFSTEPAAAQQLAELLQAQGRAVARRDGDGEVTAVLDGVEVSSPSWEEALARVTVLAGSEE